jgi:hypothetical protein
MLQGLHCLLNKKSRRLLQVYTETEEARTRPTQISAGMDFSPELPMQANNFRRLKNASSFGETSFHEVKP